MSESTFLVDGSFHESQNYPSNLARGEAMDWLWDQFQNSFRFNPVEWIGIVFFYAITSYFAYVRGKAQHRRALIDVEVAEHAKAIQEKRAQVDTADVDLAARREEVDSLQSRRLAQIDRVFEYDAKLKEAANDQSAASRKITLLNQLKSEAEAELVVIEDDLGDAADMYKRTRTARRKLRDALTGILKKYEGT